MKKITTALAVAGLAVTMVAPANAAAAPTWSNYTNVSGTLYGSEMTWDGMTWVPGTITDGDVDIDIYQTGSPVIRVISAHLHSGATLSGALTVDVYGIDGDSCTGTPVVSYSGEEISIKGVYCWNNDTDDLTELAVDVRGLTGTIMSAYFTDQEIDGQFRYDGNRRSKPGSYRYEDTAALDFVTDAD